MTAAPDDGTGSAPSYDADGPFNTRDVMPSADRITLVNGRAFIVAESDGSLRRPADGLVYEDLRMLSRLAVEIGGPGGPIRRELLGVSSLTPFQAGVVSRPDPTTSESERSEFSIHRLWVGRGARHDIEIHNTGPAPLDRVVEVGFDTDFAHLFDMKAGRRGDATAVFTWEGGIGHLTNPANPAQAVEIRVDPIPDEADAGAKILRWRIECPPRSQVTVSMTFEPFWDGAAAGLSFPLGTPPSTTFPVRSHGEWRRAAPVVATDDPRLSVAVESAVIDLASLRIFDELHSDRIVIAAGAPWFMTLFGRDSLLTSWMTLPFLPEVAMGTIDSLADLQGAVERPETEEEPGKIIHELRRHGVDEAFSHRGRYYGTVDATPLFVMVVAEAHRWRHLDDAGLAARWPAVRDALGWIRRRIAADRSGFLRYRRSTDVGLLNQGWKDSWDGVSFADGELPTGGIALAEVQGYAYAALCDAARLASFVDDPGLDPDELFREAEALRERFDARFWMEAASSYAIGLDGSDRAIDSVTTNPGHAIWAGIADTAKATRYLDRIMDGDLFSGWGLRTLSPASARYDPLSYHNGSVWPHDTAIVAAGAARIGRHDVVQQLVDAALDVASHSAGRPPELFAGVDRSVIGIPVPYPSSCSPQAWASASILLHLRSALQLTPPSAAAPSVSPVLGSGITSLTGVRAGVERFSVESYDGRWTVRREAEPA